MVLWEIVFIHNVLLLGAGRVALGCCMHTAKMLREKILAIEVVVVDTLIIVRVGRRWTQITAPVTELDMLGAHMSLPLVLGCKVGCTAISRKWAWKRPFVFRKCACLCDPPCTVRGFSRSLGWSA